MIKPIIQWNPAMLKWLVLWGKAVCYQADSEQEAQAWLSGKELT